MKKIISLFLVIFAFVTFVSFQPNATYAATKAKNTNVADWGGIWGTDWAGVVNVKVTGNKVVGTFAKGNGKITGTIKDGALTGKWTWKGNKKLKKNEGDFLWMLSSSKQIFSGNMRFGHKGPYWDIDWMGSRDLKVKFGEKIVL